MHVTMTGALQPCDFCVLDDMPDPVFVPLLDPLKHARAVEPWAQPAHAILMLRVAASISYVQYFMQICAVLHALCT